MSDAERQQWQDKWVPRVQKDYDPVGRGPLGTGSESFKRQIKVAGNPFKDSAKLADYKRMVGELRDSLADPAISSMDATEKLNALQNAFPKGEPVMAEGVPKVLSWIPPTNINLALEAISAKRAYEAGVTIFEPGPDDTVVGRTKPDYITADDGVVGDHVRMGPETPKFGETLQQKTEERIKSGVEGKVRKYSTSPEKKTWVIVDASEVSFKNTPTDTSEAIIENFHSWTSGGIRNVSPELKPKLKGVIVVGPRGVLGKDRMLVQADHEGTLIRRHSAGILDLFCSSAASARVARSVSSSRDCLPLPAYRENGSVPGEGESGRTLAELEARQVEEAFTRLAGEHGLKMVAANGHLLSPSEIHARFLGYNRLAPEVKAQLRAKFTKAASAGKGLLMVAAFGMYAKGVVDSFANETSGLDKAAALFAIVPFMGCDLQAQASKEHGTFDADDTVACFAADAMTMSPAWPAGIALHGARYFTAKWEEAQIPSITTFQKVRDDAWNKSLEEFRADGLQGLVKSAMEAEDQQFNTEKAIVLHSTAEKIVEIEKRNISDENKRLLKWNIERGAREQIASLTPKLREIFDSSIRNMIVERARQYNEGFIAQEIKIDRWTDESWQVVIQGPSHSRSDRQEYLDKLIQRLRDDDMLPPVPTADSLQPEIERARAALTQNNG